jgi:putative ABC transport system permease protein
MPLYLRLALSELRHGWRHFSVFIACLVLGVAVMAAVGMMSRAIDAALEREAQSLLGGDIEVSTGAPLSAEQLAELESLGRVSHVITLRSMMQHGELPTLIEIKAVDATYPMLGALELHESTTPEEALSGDGIIADTSLLSQLDIPLGTEISIGNASYHIRATIRKEPDRAVQIFNFGPRVLMTHEALARSGLLSPLSLAKYRYRVLLNAPEQHSALAEQLTAKHEKDSWQVSTGTDGNATLKRFINQLTAFLTLCGIATFLIAGIGIGSSARAYLQKKSHTIAVMKMMGATRGTILKTYQLTLGLLALGGGAIGVAVALVAAHFLLPLAETSGALLLPALTAAWYGLLITFLFSMPALLGTPEVRPAILFRSRTATMSYRMNQKLLGILFGLISLILTTMILSIRDTVLVLGTAGLITAAFLLFGGSAALVKRAARHIHPRRPWLKLALGNLHRPGSTITTVMFAIGISLTVLVALTLTEANFQARITSVAEEKAPTLFMMDIQPHQKESLQQVLSDAAGAENVMLQPMLRTRITALAGQPVMVENIAEDVRWAVRSDRGLSYSATQPKNAVISQGEWWAADYTGEPLVSVDERFLDGMGLKLGDTITLDVLGEPITARISNARRIDYTTFQINFSLMLSPGVVEDYPQTWLATVHQKHDPEAEKQLLRQLAREFPGITIIRTAEAVTLVREVMGYISAALRVAVLISLIAGMLVLASTLRAAMEQRMYDTAVLKVLGARKRDILKTYSAEWTLLALITSAIACALGTLGSWLVMLRFPGEGFSIMPEVTLLTAAGAIIVVWTTGYLSNHQLFRLRPARLLRNE